ncbi:hypothetical protein HYR99_16200 [Candidatus Poribacteria bacterium]|nr:hypothetical protein [Candidatus Poribacteria bacterium]
MRNHYTPIINGFPTQAMNSARIQPPGGRFSLIAIQEEVQLPTHQGIVGAQRLKIVRIEQTAVYPAPYAVPRSQFRAQTAETPMLEAQPRRELPPPKLGPQELECWLEGKPVRLRAVGEVMADEAGNFYEVRGQQLKQLGELVTDEGGRIFEVRQAGRGESPTRLYGTSESTSAETSHQQSQTNPAYDTFQPEAKASQLRQAESLRPEKPHSYRKILAEPGIRLKIPYARVKSEIAPQLKHPEQLGDNDWIECYAQIYEVQRTVPVTHIAVAELGDAAFHSQLHPLTQAKAQMLGAPQLFKPTHYPFETRASTRQIYAGQRVYRLWPVFDPTAVPEQNRGRQSDASGEKEGARRCQIPQQYMNPLQFKYSREEVLYDMEGVFGTTPPESGALTRWLLIYPLRLLKALVTSITSGRQIKKWRAMLKGKSPEDQLWEVTPPRGFSYHLAVRRWAEETLTRAGYDPQRMFVEWEIFWRRKGWN